jgi:hypothetical protein
MHGRILTRLLQCAIRVELIYFPIEVSQFFVSREPANVLYVLKSCSSCTLLPPARLVTCSRVAPVAHFYRRRGSSLSILKNTCSRVAPVAYIYRRRGSSLSILCCVDDNCDRNQDQKESCFSFGNLVQKTVSHGNDLLNNQIYVH